MFVNNKEWYKSRTIWSALATLFVSILAAIYGEADPVVAIIIGVLSGLGLYGRIQATDQIK